jgi:hypothetical protein
VGAQESILSAFRMRFSESQSRHYPNSYLSTHQCSAPMEQKKPSSFGKKGCWPISDFGSIDKLENSKLGFSSYFK